MKKIYIGIISLACCLGASAQNARFMQTSKPLNLSLPNSNGAQLISVPTDTLWGWLMNGGTPSISGATGGGFVSGSNGYLDKEKVEKFLVTTPYDVEGCVFIVGGLEGTPGATDAITTQMYNIDAVAASVNFGTSYPSPGTPVSGTNVDVLINSIDTNPTGAAGFVFVSLPSPVNVTSDYGYGVDFNANYNNSGLFVGLVTSTTGDGGGAEMCFEKWSDDTWHTLMNGWTGAPDIDLAVFPIVNMVTGINENNSYVNGMSVSKPTPNPVIGTSVLNFALQQNVKDLKISILDMSGKTIKSDDLKSLNSGQHNYNIDGTTLSNGSYIIILNADGKNVAAKFNVSK